MDLNEIKNRLNSEQYSFLRENEHLNGNIMVLGLGGSHAYGISKETSDLDIRGIALNTKREILTNENFEQFSDDNTDTVIYSFNKIIHLLASCNPNTIEILGLKPEHYFYLSKIGQELIDNRQIFLSKLAVNSFAGYASAQLRRLDNKAARVLNQQQRENHILNSIKNAEFDFKQRYFYFQEDSIKLYIDKAVQKEYDTEIFMDINLKHYPLRDYKSMWSEMSNIVKDYGKIGKRNNNAIEHNKLGKHMAHLIRLYYMCFDILEKKEIITYRENECNLLMDIRNGKYLDSNNQPVSEFYEMLSEMEKRLEYDKNNTDLPDKPDYEKIKNFTASVNERVVLGKIN